MLAQLTGVITKKGPGRYFARCLELEIDCEGSTEEEAKNRLINAVQEYIDSLCETKELRAGKAARPGLKRELVPEKNSKVFEMPSHLILH
ncbi:MAG: hypothetical protein H0Z38_08395 [Firmicutes bacterium]|nr:hypothetical protein [Bacillota bacterium]